MSASGNERTAQKSLSRSWRSGPISAIRTGASSSWLFVMALSRKLYAPEVLFRLDLSLEQSDRIRTILERCSKDLPFAEEQIRGLLTEEQNRRWQSIAP